MSIHSNSLESTIMHNALERSEEEEKKQVCSRLVCVRTVFLSAQTVEATPDGVRSLYVCQKYKIKIINLRQQVTK